MKKFYIGRLSNGQWGLLKWEGMPTKKTTGFGFLVGPFKTKRGAIWAKNNPFGYSIVSEAEERAKAEVK